MLTMGKKEDINTSRKWLDGTVGKETPAHTISIIEWLSHGTRSVGKKKIITWVDNNKTQLLDTGIQNIQFLHKQRGSNRIEHLWSNGLWSSYFLFLFSLSCLLKFISVYVITFKFAFISFFILHNITENMKMEKKKKKVISKYMV